MTALILIALAGFAAQLVDGGIGMGFGITSTTILLLAGLGPAQASAVVHAAELGTTAVSGISHWRFGNVHWPAVLKLGVPGMIAAFLGATVLSRLSLEAAVPITSTVLVLIGLNVLWRFSCGKVRRSAATSSHSTPFLAGLGLVGGFVDSTGGGGWGPVSTSTLMALGKEHPRRIVGTVSASEFLVTFGATAGFVLGLWEEILRYGPAILALLAGGAIAAPIAAWLVSRINPVGLGAGVGAAIVALNLGKALGGLEEYFGIVVPQPVVTTATIAVILVGAVVAIRSFRTPAAPTTRTGATVVEATEPQSQPQPQPA